MLTSSKLPAGGHSHGSIDPLSILMESRGVRGSIGMGNAKMQNVYDLHFPWNITKAEAKDSEEEG